MCWVSNCVLHLLSWVYVFLWDKTLPHSMYSYLEPTKDYETIATNSSFFLGSLNSNELNNIKSYFFKHEQSPYFSRGSTSPAHFPYSSCMSFNNSFPLCGDSAVGVGRGWMFIFMDPVLTVLTLRVAGPQQQGYENQGSWGLTRESFLWCRATEAL